MGKLFSVFIDSKTYSNIFYHIISFPLGMIYFVLLVTLISVGIGLSITIIGIPLLIGSMYLWRFFASIEIALAEYQFDLKIPKKETTKIKGFWPNIKYLLTDSFTWKALALCFLKFPFGLFSFVITLTFLGVSIGFLIAPFTYNTWNFGLYIWQIDSLLESLVICLAGFILLVFTLYLCNWLAAFFKKIIQLLFGSQLNEQDISIHNM
jgi:Putative sensor